MYISYTTSDDHCSIFIHSNLYKIKFSFREMVLKRADQLV